MVPIRQYETVSKVEDSAVFVAEGQSLKGVLQAFREPAAIETVSIPVNM